MCSEEQHQEKMAALTAIEKTLAALIKGRTPQDLPVIMIADTQPMALSYHDRKHVFLWIPSTAGLTLSMGQFGTGFVPGQVWINLGVREGTQIKTVGQVTPTPIYLRCTDEVVP